MPNDYSDDDMVEKCYQGNHSADMGSDATYVNSDTLLGLGYRLSKLRMTAMTLKCVDKSISNPINVAHLSFWTCT